MYSAWSVVIGCFVCAGIGWATGWYMRKLKEDMDAQEKKILCK